MDQGDHNKVLLHAKQVEGTSPQKLHILVNVDASSDSSTWYAPS